jgi:hypothetical protein
MTFFDMPKFDRSKFFVRHSMMYVFFFLRGNEHRQLPQSSSFYPFFKDY